MTAATITVTEAMLYTVLRTWLVSLLPAGTDVSQGQQNLVAMPRDPCVIMTALSSPALGTVRQEWDAGSANPGNARYIRPTEWVCQLDFYGDGAADASSIVSVLARSDAACDAMVGDILQPLYATEPWQTPMINSEEQYEERYTLEFHGQFNPTVTVPLDFAASLTVKLAEVDATFPPLN